MTFNQVEGYNTCMTENTTYNHKLTNETLTAVKTTSRPCPIDGEILSGVLFINEKGEERFLTDHQIHKLIA